MRIITVYNVKSTRKNAKREYRTYRVFRHHDKGIKRTFNKLDYWDFMEWLKLCQYDHFNIVVYSGNVCLARYSKYLMSENQIERVVYEYMKLFNKEITQEELL